MSARAIGTATVSFGLVSIPVKLYTTNQSGADISFNLLHASCGSRLKQQYICIKEEVPVERDEMGKGYEFAKGQYVMLSAEELKALDAVATNTVELAEFVPAESVDPLYFEKAYYLGPDKGGERAYKLLAEAMTVTGLVGIASYSARGKQYIVLVRPFEEGLAMHQLRYAEEVKSWSEITLPDFPAIKDAELELAKQIIQQISSATFTPERYKDEVRGRMLQLIEQKVAGQEITAVPEAPQGKIIDLMEALKASLGAAAKNDTAGALRKEPAAAATAKEAAAEEPAAPAKKRSSSKKKSSG
jgi:DNA end-binding protein Ku